MDFMWDMSDLKRAEGPVWHRTGWNTRFNRTEDSRSQRPATCFQGEPASDVKPKARGPVRVHTHTTICAHSPKQVHKIHTRIVNPLHAGHDAHSRLDCNYNTFCGELDARLHALDNTMNNVREHLRSKIDPRSCDYSLDRREMLNQGLHTQMSLSTAVFRKYCASSRPCSELCGC